MVQLIEPDASGLRWTPRPGRAFVLESAEGEAGRLGFSQTSGSLAVGSTAHGEWTLKRSGFLYPKITVRAQGSDDDCCSFTISPTGKGKVSFESGEVFSFATSGWLLNEWAFRHGVRDVVRFSRDGSCADVEILAAGYSGETLSILILLGWYAPLLAAVEAAEAAPIFPSPATVT